MRIAVLSLNICFNKFKFYGFSLIINWALITYDGCLCELPFVFVLCRSILSVLGLTNEMHTQQSHLSSFHPSDTGSSVHGATRT